MYSFNTVVVLGANGMLGAYVHRYISQFHKCAAVCRTDFDFDASAGETLNFLRTIIEPASLVVNCCGLTNKRSETELSFIRINTVLPRLLALVCTEKGSILAHIATDCVFDGTSDVGLRYDPLSHHTATDIYGLSKSLGDVGCVGFENVAVFRTSIIGESRDDRSLVEWVLGHTRGSTIKGFVNHHWSGITCLQLAKEILHRATQRSCRQRSCRCDCHCDYPDGWSGTHIIASESVTKYELVKMINEIYDAGLVIEPFSTPQPVNRVMISDRSVPGIEDQIREMYTFDILYRRG